MKIQEPNLQVEHVFLNLPCSLWWMDRKHKYLGCNIETCAALRANSPAEILGKTIIEIAKTKDLSEFKAKAIYDLEERILQTGIPEFQIKTMIPHHITESPKWQLGAIKPIFNSHNEVIGLMGVTLFDHDIGQEFKTSLQQLHLNQFKLPKHSTIDLGFKEAFQLMPASLFWINQNHDYIGGNLECCNIIGVDSQDKFIRKNIFEIIELNNWSQYKAKNISDLDEFIMRTGIPEFGIETIIPLNNQPSIHQTCAKKPIFDEKGDIIGLMGAGVYNGQFGVSERKNDLLL